jgi:sugar lactone lactonase YvrE
MRIFALCVLFSSLLFAEGTQTWEQSKFDDFEKGTAHGVAIRSDGDLELAPQFKPLYTSPSTYLWSVTADRAGNVYAAAGSPARLYRITPDGKASSIFEPQELQVQAVVERDGILYAATSPDGKVYKIEVERGKPAPSAAEAQGKSPSQSSTAGGAWKSSVFFDPQTKYIWALAMDAAGNLYIATGDHGEIFRVSKSGEGSVFFKSDEAHIRALAIDNRGNIIAGSDGSGLVYRISPAGEAFVLYSAPKKEITALALDEQGNIYAAGAGEKHSSNQPAPGQPAANPPNQPAPNVSGGAIPPAAIGMNPQGAAPAGSVTGSEIYKISSDGSPTRLWTSHDDLVYALAFDRADGKQRLLAGTGNRGRIFAIRDNGDFTDLLKASANQVTAFAPAPGGSLYLATSNLGKIFLLGPGLETEGAYESDVFDAHIFSRWGRAQVRGRGAFDLYARSGNVDNPDRNWSPWRKINLATADSSTLDVPPARFVQWKAVLRSPQTSPRLESVSLNYRPKNMAPVVDEVSVQVGSHSASSAKNSGDSGTGAAASGGNNPSSGNASATGTPHDRDSIAVRWSAHDDNDDDLVYSLFYRGDGENRWRQLTRDRLTDKSFNFDPELLPDGGYQIKVVASDAPSHSPDEALTGEKESARFQVDNTPPRIEDLNAALDSDGQVHVTFRAADAFSEIRRAEYSLDASDWQFVEPVGQLSDSKTENYDFSVALPFAAPGDGLPSTPPASRGKRSVPAADPPAVPAEHVVVVRVYDRFDNVASAKAIIHAK